MSQTTYLCKQLDQLMKYKQRAMESPTGSCPKDLNEAESQHSRYEEEPQKSARTRRPIIDLNSNDFRVDIPEFKGKLDPQEFLDWLSTIERYYKVVPEHNKVNLVALKL